MSVCSNSFAAHGLFPRSVPSFSAGCLSSSVSWEGWGGGGCIRHCSRDQKTERNQRKKRQENTTYVATKRCLPVNPFQKRLVTSSVD